MPHAPEAADLDALNVSYLEALLALMEQLVAGEEPAAPEGVGAAARERAAAHGWVLPMDWLVHRYGLDEAEAAILGLALTPYLDASFRDRLAKLRDNVLLGFVDGHTALRLLFDDRGERLRGQRYFSRAGRLRAHRLIELARHRDGRASDVLSREVVVPSRVVSFVLGRIELDEEIADMASLSWPSVDLYELVVSDEARRDLQEIVGQPDAVGRGRLLVARVSGPPGSGRTMCAEAIAKGLGRRLLTLDGARLAGADGGGLESALAEVFQSAELYDAVLCLDRADAAFGAPGGPAGALSERLASFGGVVVLATDAPNALAPELEAQTAFAVDLALPTGPQRALLWRRALAAEGAEAAPEVQLDDVGLLFELTGGQIGNAARLAVQRTAPGDDGRVVLDHDALARVAHAQLRANMEDYAARSRVDLTLADLVLPEEPLADVRQLLDAARHRAQVMNRWGFGKRLVTGKGIVAMFTGEPGTGKTLCAEILASELGLRLYQVSIPKITSKYIGDTEKNISKIFSAARASHSMLLFDEADALFTKRVAVERSTDRFSNMGVNLLLQEIERFEGIVLLTTNLERDLDPAFQRRITYKIAFPFPDADSRERIWQKLIPAECPLEGEIDYGLLADAFELAGGHIKNVILRAAYRAASEGRGIAMTHFRAASEAECRAAGKLFRYPSE